MLTSQEIIEKIEKHFSVFSFINEGKIPYLLFPRQKNVIEEYEAHRFNLVTKPRQAGISTTTAAYLAIKATFIGETPEAICIITPYIAQGKNNLKIIKEFILQLPREIWGDEYVLNPCKKIFITDNSNELKLLNGSRIKILGSSIDAICGWSPSLIIMEDAAFISRGKDIYVAAISSLCNNGKMIIISTPNGLDPLFFKLYDQAKTGRNNFNVIEMKWYEDLRYNKDLRWYKENDILIEEEFTFESYEAKIDGGWKPTSSWYEEMCRHLGPELIKKELDNEFYIPENIC